jgi:hypothetical protein
MSSMRRQVPSANATESMDRRARDDGIRRSGAAAVGRGEHAVTRRRRIRGPGLIIAGQTFSGWL